MIDTIFALSSGAPPSGVAVVRVSGPSVRFALETTIGRLPVPRRLELRTIGGEGDPIDHGLVAFFPAPSSFTGEDVAEYHLHGGRAVLSAFLELLGGLPGLRLAEAGEFTRRAFENDRLDLTEAEGLADLIAAETDAQRRQALRLAGGAFRQKAEDWRRRLIELRAHVEADLDFSDEEDVPADVSSGVVSAIARLRAELERELLAGKRGERIRDGLEVVVLGPPNAGKSSLINALAERDVAIVTDIPGTTRDLLEVRLDLDGYAVTLVDTAGLREGGDVIEVEGMRRGRARAASADIVLWLDENDDTPPEEVASIGCQVIGVRTKADLAPMGKVEQSVSIHDRASLDRLLHRLALEASSRLGGEAPLVSRARQRQCLEQAEAALREAERLDLPAEVIADQLRRAGDALGRLSGRIDVEDVLGSIFSTFCIGK
ncbi:tRNA uridine-5-carboxymethylaminomethyl(34) synthesis GTPase MnmE [Pleomorphomonas sp. JP5]|uniref:tRNA uridine-5-carboxymethylaminomethyl(34) synthesis GTPase MnmE n=1 Tax=Pleomorphomonas sp. JP5 TaxID=2942998 RepID=UPI002043679A|nr:tRNA uridine-5-carboxymethylaminomethyl(34) synthesis GTPase MnmE [Pleomorphomonas sp. JP5]MCM5559747.1 tRNA uridine-5-carboxymethylaminomethyl(34) synthesis GTPase MnmE [Pleomorphomonas sp. JP5]